MLNEAGRSKASLIADALNMYACYGATAYGDLFNGRNMKSKVTKISHHVLEIDEMTHLPKGIKDTGDGKASKQLNDNGFWKSVGDSVESFFD